LVLLADDVRYALRSLRKTPSFTLPALLALAVGVGANVSIFSLVDPLLLRPLPLAHPENLVYAWEDESYLGFPRDTPAPANFADWKQRNHVFTDMGAMRGDIFALTGDGSPEQVEGNAISANLFPLLGAAPILGRNILPEEDQPGRDKVALISFRLWQERYGANPGIVGREILLDNAKLRIIGVMPRGFRIPERSDVWIPIALSPQQMAVRGSHYLQVYARLKPGVTLSAAQRDMSAIAAQLASEYPATNMHVGAVVVGLRGQFLDTLQLGLWVLAGGVGCVLLICCANLAGLLLARAAGRQREWAIRAALGAGRLQLLRQGLMESMVVAIGGSVLALLIAVWSVPLLGRLVPQVLTGWAMPRLDLRLFVFAVLISVLCGLLSGVLPALASTRLDLASSLQSGSRTVTGGMSRLRRALVTGEVALAVLLAAGAGLMVQTVWNLAHVHLGFRTEGILTMRTSLNRNLYPQFPARNAYYSAVIDRIRAIPGVVSAGYTTYLPLTNRGGTSGFAIEGAPPPVPGEHNDANHRVVSLDYLQTIGVRLLAGRFFDHRDGPDTMPVAIINDAMARQFWGDRDPIGRRFHFSEDNNSSWFTVVGVVDNVRQMGLNLAGRAEMYFPSTQPKASFGFFSPRDLAVRVDGDPMHYAGAVQKAVWSVDRTQPIADVQPLADLVDRELFAQKTQLALLAAFAVLALMLAAIGLYGLLSHMVVQRTREIGVRMALGARQGQVLAAMMRQGMALVSLGLIAGVAAAWILTRFMQKLLYGVKPNDPLTFAAVVMMLLAAGAAACYIPARRATRIEPLTALRQE
jgi:predicted permease